MNMIKKIKNLINNIKVNFSDPEPEPDIPVEDCYYDDIAEVDIEDSYRKFYNLRDKNNE